MVHVCKICNDCHAWLCLTDIPIKMHIFIVDQNTVLQIAQNNIYINVYNLVLIYLHIAIQSLHTVYYSPIYNITKVYIKIF